MPFWCAAWHLQISHSSLFCVTNCPNCISKTWITMGNHFFRTSCSFSFGIFMFADVATSDNGHQFSTIYTWWALTAFKETNTWSLPVVATQQKVPLRFHPWLCKMWHRSAKCLQEKNVSLWVCCCCFVLDVKIISQQPLLEQEHVFAFCPIQFSGLYAQWLCDPGLTNWSRFNWICGSTGVAQYITLFSSCCKKSERLQMHGETNSGVVLCASYLGKQSVFGKTQHRRFHMTQLLMLIWSMFPTSNVAHLFSNQRLTRNEKCHVFLCWETIVFNQFSASKVTFPAN